MTHPRDYLPILDLVEAALEASCGALITLQRIDADLAGRIGPTGIHRHVAHAVQSLRDAIEELRSAHSTGTNGLALGFVLEGQQRAPAAERGQSRPRRTA